MAQQIQPQMMVHDADDNMIGTVDRVEGDRIKLTREDSPDGEHQYVSLHEVDQVDGDKVCLRQGASSSESW